MSPAANTSGWPGSERSGSTRTRPARSVSAPVASARSPRQGRRRDARGPDDRARPDRLARPVGHRQLDAVGGDPDDRRLQHRRDAELLERPRRSARQPLGKRRQDPVGGLDEQDAGRPRVDGAKVAAQRVARELGDLAGHLHARRAGADDDERQPRPPSLLIRLDLGRLERGEQACPQVERALERLQLRRVRRPLVVPEVRVRRPARHDEGVVRELDAAVAVRQLVQQDDAALEVEARHLRQDHIARSSACAGSCGEES